MGHLSIIQAVSGQFGDLMFTWEGSRPGAPVMHGADCGDGVHGSLDHNSSCLQIIVQINLSMGVCVQTFDWFCKSRDDGIFSGFH